ncbi:MAG: hypothetical protein ACE5EO_10690 [Candidatus Krumholzibacteriia bacterium]
MSRVIAAEKLTPQHTAYEIEAPELAAAAAAGQLLMARLGDQVRFTPHAIADFEPDKGTVTVVARTVAQNGDGVPDGELDPGDIAIELTGPMGKRDDARRGSKVLCVADRLGVAALYPRLREYKERDCYTVVIAGYPSRDQVYWQDRLNNYSDELYVVTEDGSFGIRGPIQQTVRAVCRHVTDLERALAIGPMPFLKACANATRNYGISTMISLNAVVENENDLHPAGDDEVAPFDWHDASDLDGHAVDFDKLGAQIGIPPEK